MNSQGNYCYSHAPGRNAPLIRFLILASLYVSLLFGCLSRMLPHLSFFLHFFLTHLLLFYENRPALFPGQMS